MGLSNRKSFTVLFCALILLLILLSRAPYFGWLELDAHEVWTMWQSVGTLPQVVDRTPYDWGPLYYSVMLGWQSLVGNHAVTARMLSVIWLVLGSVFMYRSMARLRRDTAPFMAMLLYAASAGIIYLSVNIRGYAIQLALMPLGFWLTLRYFDSRRYTWQQVLLGAMLAGTMIAMVYVHPTGMLACVPLGVFTVFAYPRRLWRWWLPGLLTLLVSLPQLNMRFGTATTRLNGTVFSIDFKRVYSFFQYYGGHSALQQVITAVLICVALIFLWRSVSLSGKVLALFASILGGCVLLIFLGGRLGFSGERHAWWLVTPVVLTIAWGLSYLPRPATFACFGILIVGLYIPSLPGQLDESGSPNPPMGVNFAWLARNARWGDAVVIDPRQQCTRFKDKWDYYTRLYFPQGINFVDNPESYRRVWYISADGWEAPQLKAAVNHNRLPAIFNGPWNCLFRLYVAPPDVCGILYDNGMRFHGYEVIEDGQPISIPLIRRENDSITVRLWWSADTALSADYSVGLYILDTEHNALVAQLDSEPQLIKLDPMDFSTMPSETSQWKPRQLYVEERTLHVPNILPVTPEGINTFALALTVYQSGDNIRADAPGLTREHIRILQDFVVRSW